MIGKAHQRIIRESKVKIDNGGLFGYPEADIKNAICKRIDYKTAEKIILEYEWLGTMGQGMYCYGIYFENVCAGVVCFGLPSSIIAGDICGEKYRDIAICLERGACTWWAHEHSASKLISFAINDMAKNTKYRIFYAYSDESAGEIGTVYQACNWLYLGKMNSGGSQLKLIRPDGKKITSRHIIKMAQKIDKKIDNTTDARNLLLSYGYILDRTKPKAKYVIFKGTKNEIRNFYKELRYPVQPYPKRILND